eukprot:CAMPEP_0183348600 /NCGR_PEP_ID=MMETSP0164_2-20130417/13065_1 /TAXON_ID=221442 /ORGANISM="Coccolithus pelagicus ssp braarudi, Strain PLY182g" /LENGTH=85 /DNA_ID=CAMNT_0025520221 /DNA_START=393 /DNA_END=647 /DNA_ORIENTATION=-
MAKRRSGPMAQPHALHSAQASLRAAAPPAHQARQSLLCGSTAAFCAPVHSEWEAFSRPCSRHALGTRAAAVEHPRGDQRALACSP